MTRGIVVPLTANQRATRMLWLAQQAPITALDQYVKRPALDELHKIPGYEHAPLPVRCCDGYYLLKEHNGGKDPTAIDPFDRWSHDGSAFVNRTADCIGGMAWCGGFDRYQPVRFSHLYDGWINTDSMLMDATGLSRCFRQLERPEVGCFVVFKSGSAGHKVGHIGGVTKVPAEWDRFQIECWRALDVVDMAARTGPGNRQGNPLTWYYAHGQFVVPIMH